MNYLSPIKATVSWPFQPHELDELYVGEYSSSSKSFSDSPSTLAFTRGGKWSMIKQKCQKVSKAVVSFR